MKTMKKLLACGLIAATALCVSSCGGETAKNKGGLTKLKVEVFDRNNAPEGQGSAIDNKWTKWLAEEAAKIGIDLEYVACPRAQEKEKLNVWMASNGAPDIVFTYDYALASTYAEQNGIYDLTEYIDKEGPAIKEKLKETLPYGVYNGKQYFIPGISVRSGSGPLKIRKDWLDKLGLPMPSNIDELYETLKAFKEKDPGGVGSENVVPFAIPAPGVVGTPGYYGDIMLAFGVRNDVEGFPAMVGGNYDEATKTFRSPVDLPEAKEAYRFLNKLYHEGLIHREFAVDNNGTKYNQHVASGVAGLVDCNGLDINPMTKDAVPDVEWAIMDPLPNPDGERTVKKISPVRWYNMVPKSSKVPEAAVKFINWMLDSKADTVLYYGFEGDNYDLNDGIITVRDEARNKTELNWVGQDLNLVGAVNYVVPAEKRALAYTGESGLKTIRGLEIEDEYGKAPAILNAARPIAQARSSQLQKYVYEGAAKVIVADDFDAEYDNYVAGWKKLGGDEYDAEIAEILSKR